MEKSIKGTVGLLFCILLILVGCSREIIYENKSFKASSGLKNNITEVVLNDGTRCVVLTGPEGRGGINCDWK